MVSEGQGILSGIRVLEFGQVLAGPHCCLLLKALGAEVIKVERPRMGDPARYDPYIFGPGLSGYFFQQNIGKRSLCVDLRLDEGRSIIRDLIRVSDVIVENLRPGSLEKFGLGYPEVRAVRPDIIMCSISAYGQTGPYAGRPGFGPIVEAMAGIPDQTGEAQGPPMPTQVPIADYATASHAFGAICAALFFRDRTGRGMFIDMALLDCTFAMHDWAVQFYLSSKGKQQLRRRGLLSPVAVPWGMFRCPDGQYLLLMAETDALWGRLLQAIGDPELKEAPRFATHQGRTENWREVYTRIQAWIDKQVSVEEAIQILEDLGIPCTRVRTIADAVEHPQIRARDMIIEVDDPVLGRMKTLNVPFKFSEGEVSIRGHYPLLGEDNEYVLAEVLGYEPHAISTLYDRGVVYRADAPERDQPSQSVPKN